MSFFTSAVIFFAGVASYAILHRLILGVRMSGLVIMATANAILFLDAAAATMRGQIQHMLGGIVEAGGDEEFGDSQEILDTHEEHLQKWLNDNLERLLKTFPKGYKTLLPFKTFAEARAWVQLLQEKGYLNEID